MASLSLEHRLSRRWSAGVVGIAGHIVTNLKRVMMGYSLAAIFGIALDILVASPWTGLPVVLVMLSATVAVLIPRRLTAMLTSLMILLMLVGSAFIGFYNPAWADYAAIKEGKPIADFPHIAAAGNEAEFRRAARGIS